MPGGLNRRIKKVDKESDPDVEYSYYYNTSWQIVEVRKDGAEDPYKQYLWCLRYIDAPVLRWWDANGDGDFADENETLYYTNDANMNVTAVVNTAGNVVERYSYDPYGRVTVRHGVIDSASNDTSADEWDERTSNTFENDILYTGYLYDDETGLFHVRHRTYHPTLGRWLQRDPLGYVDGMSLYLYAGGYPISATDPRGLRAATLLDELADLVREGSNGLYEDYERHSLADMALWLTTKRLRSQATTEFLVDIAKSALEIAKLQSAIFGGGPILKWTLEGAGWILDYVDDGVEGLIRRGIFMAADYGASKGLRAVLGQSEKGKEVVRKLTETYQGLVNSPSGRIAVLMAEGAKDEAKQLAWQKARDAILGGVDNQFIEEMKVWKLEHKRYDTRGYNEDTCGGRVSGSVVWIRFSEGFRPQFTDVRGQNNNATEQVEVTAYGMMRGQFVGAVCIKGDWEVWSVTASAYATNDISYKDLGSATFAAHPIEDQFRPSREVRLGNKGEAAPKRRKDRPDSFLDGPLERRDNSDQYRRR